MDSALWELLRDVRTALHALSAEAWESVRRMTVVLLNQVCMCPPLSSVIIRAVLNNDPSRFRSLECRFSAPVFPGDSLRVSVWKAKQRKAELASDEEEFLFRVENISRANQVAVERGVLVGRPRRKNAGSKL